MTQLLDEIRLATRSLGRSAGFTAVAVLSLAIALSLTTVMFGLVDAAIHPYAPFRDPAELYSIGVRGGRFLPSAYEQLLTLRRTNRFASGMAIVSTERLTVQTASDTREVLAAVVSPNFFTVYGVAPILGRTWLTADGLHADERQAIVSERLWTQLGGTRAQIGRLVFRGNDASYTVVAVMSRTLDEPTGADLWLPIPSSSLARGDGLNGVEATVRLADGGSATMLRRALDQFTQMLTAEYGRSAASLWYTMVPLWQPVSRYNGVHVALVGAVAIVLLIACANLSQLVLGRGLTRRRELAIRAALGASRGALIRHTLVECALIVLAAAALGALFAVWGSGIVAAAIPRSVRDLGLLEPRLSWRVFAIGLSVSVLVAMGFALLPALRAAGADPAEPIKDGSAATTRRNRHRYSGLVIAEVTLSTTLLVAAGLLIRSASEVSAFDFGYDATHIVTAVQFGHWSALTISDASDFTRVRHDLIARAEAIPGVQGAALMGRPTPLRMTISYEEPGSGFVEKYLGDYDAVTPHFLRALGLHVVEGRDFDDGDVELGAIVVTRAAARHYWPLGTPIGRIVKLGPGNSSAPSVRVVGVVADAFLEPTDVGADPLPRFFVVSPTATHLAAGGAQTKWFPGYYFTLVVRGSQPIGALSLDVRRLLRTEFPEAPSTARIAPWTDRLTAILELTHFLTALFIVLALFGLLVSAVGIYGVLAHAVSQRMREFALRVALGAERADVVRLVVHDGAVMLLAGTGIGAILALVLARTMRNRVFGLDTYDAIALIAAELALLMVGLVACWIPARRATRANPVDVLRSI